MQEAIMIFKNHPKRKKDQICYYKIRHYKYRITHDYEIKIRLKPPKKLKVDENFIIFEKDGTLKIKQRYAWDGPSGPTIDTPNFMRGSLIHDALYQLLREGDLEKKFRKKFRKDADQILKEICLIDGMSSFRAKYVYWGVRIFGIFTIKAESDSEQITNTFSFSG